MVSKSGSVNTKLIFILNLHHFIKYLISWEIMPFLALFSFFYIIQPINPFFFGIIELIVLLMVYKLAFDVLTDVAKGNMTPTVNHNYLVSNTVGIKVALLALLINLIKMWLEGSEASQPYVQDFVWTTTFITPAIFMSLAISNSMPHALNPITLFKIIKTSYISYFTFVMFWIGNLYLLDNLISPFIFHFVPQYLDGIVVSFIGFSILLVNFQIMGYLLFQNRREFDLHEIAGFYPTDSDFVKVEEDAPANPYHERIKGLLIDDNVELAMSMVVELQQNGDNSHELIKLYQMALDKKLNESTPYAIAEKIHFRIEKNQIKRAFENVIELFESEKTYVEHSPNDIYPLIKHAMSVNKIEYIAKLVRDFDKKYSNHPDLVANYFILAKVIYRVRKNRWESKILLEKLMKNFPNDPMIDEIKSWHKGMKLIEKRPYDL